MRIEPIRKESRGTATRYTARAGGRDLFFELDQSQAVAANNIADSFLLMALAPSMLAGSAIEIEDDSVSPALVENLLRAQEVDRQPLRPRQSTCELCRDAPPRQTTHSGPTRAPSRDVRQPRWQP